MDLSVFMTSGGLPQPLSHEEQARLWGRWRAGEGRAREELVRTNVRLVVSLANRYGGGTDEALSAGLLGLAEALNRWDPEQSALTTYATPRIRGAILNDRVSVPETVELPEELAPQGSATPVGEPLELVEELLPERELEALRGELAGRTQAETAERLGCSLPTVRGLGRRARGRLWHPAVQVAMGGR